MTFKPVRSLVFLTVLCAALAGLAGRAIAFEVVTIPDGINAVNLGAALDVLPGEDGRVQISQLGCLCAAQ